MKEKHLIKSILSRFSNIIDHLHPLSRLLILMAIDALIVSTAVNISFFILNKTANELNTWILTYTIIVLIPLYLFTGKYDGITRYIGSKTFYSLTTYNLILIISIIPVGKLFQIPVPKVNELILLWINFSESG